MEGRTKCDRQMFKASSKSLSPSPVFCPFCEYQTSNGRKHLSKNSPSRRPNLFWVSWNICWTVSYNCFWPLNQSREKQCSVSAFKAKNCHQTFLSDDNGARNGHRRLWNTLRPGAKKRVTSVLFFFLFKEAVHLPRAEKKLG